MSNDLKFLHVIKDKIATKTRMHLENDIMAAWGTKEDLEQFIQLLVDHPDVRLDEQDVWNYIDSIKTVHDMRMQVLMDTFSQAHHLDGYGTAEEVQACQREINETQEVQQKKKKGEKNK